MIVRMSKVEIAGPKAMRNDLLALLQESGMFHLEPEVRGFISKADEAFIRSMLPDEKELSERLFLENLSAKISELLSYLPHIEVRTSYIEPFAVIDLIAKSVKKHSEACRSLYERRETLRKEFDEFNRYAQFLSTIEGLFKDVEKTPDLEFIGLTIKEPAKTDALRRLLASLTGGRFELTTAPSSDGTAVALITVEKSFNEKIKKALSDERIPEISFPPSFSSLAFPAKIKYLRERVYVISQDISGINNELEKFTCRWKPIYIQVSEWVNGRLSLLRASASVFESGSCFFIYGWMPADDFKKAGEIVEKRFGGMVVVQEKEIREEDLERVPVVIKNPRYFEPFEIFVRFLPLPRYSSMDPTPFIGIFFPVFFGMILGDAGYAVILFALSLFMMKRYSKARNVKNAFQILSVSSFYAFFFGLLYGEFFGELGHSLFGLEPICIERRTAVIPMLYFALTVGIVHVILGLILGFITSLKRKMKKEAIYRFLNLVIVICILFLVSAFFDIFPALLTRPVIITILVLTPLLLFTGGLLAPLELLKNIGNIISYARIMAIGLTSVLLAFVANRLAGMMGNIVIGITVAVLLHTLNIILGVFSPAIHSIRLHYVEFFTKFIEPGGRKFEPIKK